MSKQVAAAAGLVRVKLEGRGLPTPVVQTAQSLAVMIGQDTDGRFRIVRRVGWDRVTCTVDPDARGGHKSSARGFDGYKGHGTVDLTGEIVTGAAVGPGWRRGRRDDPSAARRHRRCRR